MIKRGQEVQVETNGTIFPLSFFIKGLYYVIDYKLNSSGMTKAMLPSSFFATVPDPHWIKMVLDNEEDYQQAKNLIAGWKAGDFFGWSPNIAFSPTPNLELKKLVEWMKVDKLYDIVLSMQLHKTYKIK